MSLKHFAFCFCAPGTSHLSTYVAPLLLRKHLHSEAKNDHALMGLRGKKDRVSLRSKTTLMVEKKKFPAIVPATDTSAHIHKVRK